MNALDRLPAWATTGVGSLPFNAVDHAVAHVATAYDVPFCPQLPRLDGDMISEWLGGDPGRCGWSPARDRERPRAWDAFLCELDRSPPAHRVVKLQVTGPATLACALARASGTPSRREALALAHELAVWLAANVSAQIRTLRDRGLDTLLVVDEPALHVFGTEDIERVWDPLRAVAPHWGLHLCGPVPWETVTRAEPDVLSFDLALSPLDRSAASALRGLLARGGRVAWGVVQPHRPEHGLHAVKRLREALAVVEAGGEQSLLTASCGSGRMSPAREAEITTALWDTARAVREPAARWLG
ncbi:hypothetical protein OM076_23535 [Solirubrobacter ginsenosidimutans]|uniref:Cobalamin-independent methionine synthase MetE C-terminal/archaeal domain-containing protein n=1 Tax=Solirubrobacter ginsenosidimutans TaxID=490573 RepID=A0A9X3MY37_9ACTN|nr:hypothetical protein [Solirubrobacter ginsenosidimutans]MDA0163267.1 hypothetical protein [Solirubrobacter ginsenosidimutans]